MKKLSMLIVTFFFALIFSGADSLSAEENETDVFTLEEITVTAEKREQNQQKVPIAMEVISGEEIKETGRTDLDTILSNVSSAIIQRAADGLRVSIRGLSDDSSTFRGQSMATPTVAINTDGIMTNRKDTGAGLFDVSRVEVLFGPQSTLYASNSPGGIVNIVTNNPNTEKYEISGTLEYGNYDLLHTEGAMNVPVTDTIAIRTAFSTQVRGGYLSNGTDDQDSKSVRFRTLYEVADNFSIIATAQLTKSAGAGRSNGVVMFVDQDDVDDPWTATGSSGGGGNSRDNESFSANIEWKTKFGSLSVIPSYSTGESNSTSVRVMGGTETTQIGTQTSEEQGVEVRMASTADFFFKWILGFNYYDSEDSNHRDTVDSPIWSERTILETAYAAFANITYPVMDKLRLTAGYRRSWDDFNSLNHEITWRRLPGGVQETMEMDQNILMEYSNPDYKVGFEYDLANNAMLFGDYSTSYRVRGMAQQNTNEPEELKAYSIGAKTRFFENKVQVNASAYYYDYSNYGANQRVVVTFDTDGDGDLDKNDTNATDPNSATDGDGRMMGIDLQTAFVITSQDILNLSVSWEDSEWTDLYFDYYYEYTDAIDEETGLLIQVPIEDASYNGKPMTNTPPWTISANYSHNFPLWNGGSLKTTIDVRYQTGYRLSWKDADYPNNYQEDYRMINLSAGYSHPDGKWSLSAYVRNLENYAVKRMYLGAGGMGQLSIGSPRTYGAVLSLRY